MMLGINTKVQPGNGPFLVYIEPPLVKEFKTIIRPGIQVNEIEKMTFKIKGLPI